MSAMADKLGWRYTRYADDLTWSIEAEPSPSVGYVLARIRHIVDDEGFSVNHRRLVSSAESAAVGDGGCGQ